jgi:hypothetical protein
MKFDGPAAVGVPEMTPAELIARPGGSAPLASDHVYGGLPPVAPSVVEYGTPTVAAGSDVVVMTSGGATVIDSDLVVECVAASVTFTVKVDVPALVGVPEMTPALLIASPAGSEPIDTDHV